MFGFEQLGRMGLGVRNAKAHVERVEVLRQWQPIGEAIYHDGRVATNIGAQRDTAYRYDAAQINVEHAQVQWADWERTSTRGAEPRSMKLGGLIGSAVLRNVPPNVRAVLLAGSLVHIGKACVFGHGKVEIQAM